MRILVLGGDAFTDPRGVFVRLDDICIAHVKAKTPLPGSLREQAARFVLLYPDGSIAGEIADLWARKRGVASNKWPAPHRLQFNSPILDDGRPDLVVCYPGAPRWLVKRAVRRGIRAIDAS